MSAELQPLTEEGRRAVEIAEKLAADFATRADEHDREGTFPYENWDSLRESGLLGITIGTEYGGLGVTSVNDYVTAFNRLARADGSTALGAMMHAAGGLLFSLAASASDDVRTMMEPMLRGFGTGQVIVCGAHSEPSANFAWWMAEGTPVDGGYRVNGSKIFGTNSPVATHFHLFFRAPDGDGGWWTMASLVERDAPGLIIGDDWDALGMRASGSNTLTFRDCFVPAEAAEQFAPWGEISPDFFPVMLAAITGQAAVFLGVAEAARDWVIEFAKCRVKAPSEHALAERPGIQRAVAEMELSLATAQAVVERQARRVDQLLAGDLDRDPSEMVVGELQCTKLVATQSAIDVVDKAMQISGGGGYMSGSPLGRLYRDVRAGPFMQAYSPNEAYDVIGKSALGLPAKPNL